MEWATSLRVTGVRPELFWEQPVKIMVRQPSSAAAEKRLLRKQFRLLISRYLKMLIHLKTMILMRMKRTSLYLMQDTRTLLMEL